MYAICDIAMHLILTRAQYPEVREFSLEYTRIPDMYFQQQPESYQNNKIYVPLDMYNFNNTVSSKSTVPSIIVRKLTQSLLSSTENETYSWAPKGSNELICVLCLDTCLIFGENQWFPIQN